MNQIFGSTIKPATTAIHANTSAIGTTTHSLYAWIKHYDPQQPKTITEANASFAELAKLRKELQRVTEERDILKKAAVYFASRSQ